MLPSSDLGNVTSETQFKDGRSNLLQLTLPGNSSLANRSFRVRVNGRVATTTTVNLTLSVYFGTSSTIGSNTLVFSSGQTAVNNITSTFGILLEMQWSADGNSIAGSGQGQIGNNALGFNALNNTPLNVNPNRDSNTNLQSGVFYGFTVTGQFSGSSAGNHATIDNFELEGA